MQRKKTKVHHLRGRSNKSSAYNTRELARCMQRKADMEQYLNQEPRAQSSTSLGSWSYGPAKSSDYMKIVVDGPLKEDEALELARIFVRKKPTHLMLRFDGPFHYPWHVWKHPRTFLGLKREAIKSVQRYAVVGGPKWLKRVLVVLDPLFRMEMKHFEHDDEVSAHRWLDVQSRTQQFN
jgi:hypothetical protein